MHRYNSALILTTQGNLYKVMAAPEDFMSPSFDVTSVYAINNDTSSALLQTAQTIKAGVDAGKFERLDPKECSKHYLQQYVSKWRDVLVIQAGSSRPGDSHSYTTFKTPDPQYHVRSNPRSSEYSYGVFPVRSDPHRFPSCSWQCAGLDAHQLFYSGDNLTTVFLPAWSSGGTIWKCR